MNPKRHKRNVSKAGALLGLSVLLLHAPGCAFFGAEFDECFEDGSCSDATGGAVGDGDGDGDGDNQTMPTGGQGDGDGDSAGGQTSGGQGAGGNSGGTGGDGSGGVGSGGDSTGGNGTGGNGSGGTGTGGVPQDVLDLRRDLSLNEVRHGSTAFVELYNGGSGTLPLTDLYIVVAANSSVGPAYGDACQLSSASVASDAVLLTTTHADQCVFGPPTCVFACEYTIGAGSVIYLLKSTGEWSEAHEIDSVEYPSGGELPALTDSYQAVTDGSDTFATDAQSLGYNN